MRIALTGSHGLIGTALFQNLTRAGHEVWRLVRLPQTDEAAVLHWDPMARTLDPAKLEGFDAAIHLAGENLASGRWTNQRKVQIRESRVRGTQLLSDALANLRQPPRTLLSASAVGIYGDRGGEELTETSPIGRGFLADVCAGWEAATNSAAQAGVRVVHLRFGIVLAAQGGALAKMLPLFRLGLGGPLGKGRQYWSWIALEDAVAAIERLLLTDLVDGPVNVVSPAPVANREFTRELGRILRRPAILAAPAFALRLALGPMADEALLASSRALPAKLQGLKFAFRHPNLAGALAAILG